MRSCKSHKERGAAQLLMTQTSSKILITYTCTSETCMMELIDVAGHHSSYRTPQHIFIHVSSILDRSPPCPDQTKYPTFAYSRAGAHGTAAAPSPCGSVTIGQSCLKVSETVTLLTYPLHPY